MAKDNLENRSIPTKEIPVPAITVSVCAHQDMNDPAYQKLVI